MTDLQDLSIEEAKALIQKQAQRKPSKYRNKKTAYGGRVYDSAREAQHALELDAQLKVGIVCGWTPQVDFELIAMSPQPAVDGVKVGTYRADFVVEYRGAGVYPNRFEVQETKGFETREWKLKRRIFQANYPEIELRVIR